jgi:hypothetical protein
MRNDDLYRAIWLCNAMNFSHQRQEFIYMFQNVLAINVFAAIIRQQIQWFVEIGSDVYARHFYVIERITASTFALATAKLQPDGPVFREIFFERRV